MSVLDELTTLERRVLERLRELRPLVSEFRELERAAKRLGLDAEGNTQSGGRTAANSGARRKSTTRAKARRSGAAAKRRSSTRQTRAKTRSDSAPGPNDRQQQVLELVRAQPGVTVRELGEQLGVHPTSLYRIVDKLKSSGDVTKEGVRLQPRRSPQRA